ncbi:MAG: Ig-like domain-containing protein [Alcanivorax sp.]|nr:Ig-like domain-containing protein [Alcanivorax sp.]
MRIKSSLQGAALVASLALFAACEDSSRAFQPPEIGDGLIYTYPLDGTVDVPLGTKTLFVFSNPVDPAAALENCTAGTDGVPEGSFCLVGPDGPVDIAAMTEIVNDGKTIQFSTDRLAQGTRYEVWLRESAAPGAVNLPETGPLLSFRTRQSAPVPGQPPRVLAINQDSPEAFLDGSGRDPRFPFMDFAPIRVTFSEPLAQKSVRLGETFSFVKVNLAEDGSVIDEEPVDVSLHTERHYISLQPLEDMEPGARYELRLTDAITDLGSEPLAAITYRFLPENSKENPGDENPPIRQVLQTFPSMGDPGFPLNSRLSDLTLNQFRLVNDVLGVNEVDAFPDALEAWLADPVKFPVETPIVARAGQKLRLTGINPAKLGGEVDLNLNTGNITGVFFNNVTAYLLPNPYRPVGTNPDDDVAPLIAIMNFDLSMQGEDPAGNATFNQNIMHVQAPGVVTITEGTLNIELFTTLQFEVLGGASTINADFALGVRSDLAFVVDPQNPEGPIVTGSFPEDGDVGVETRENILLTVSDTLSHRGLNEVMLLNMDQGGAMVPIKVNRDGTTLVVTPLNELQPASRHELILPPSITDADLFNPLPLEFRADDALGGDGVLSFTTADYSRDNGVLVPPMLVNVYPGVGCALTAVGSQPGKAGRCVSSLPTDVQYENFLYEIDTIMDVNFSQPMDTASMRPGTINGAGNACNGGAICIGENIDGTWQNIPLTLHAENMAAQLFPEEGRIVEGGMYRLVVNGSGDTFRNHPDFGNLAVNTDPLGSINAPGGPNIIADFEAVAATSTIFATIRTRPFTDTNGNGFFDAGEFEALGNGATLIIDGTGGVITDADFSDPDKDKLFISGALPVGFKPIVPIDLGNNDLGMIPDGPGRWCTPPEVDANGESVCIDTVGDFMTPVDVGTQIVLGTSLSLDATALVVPINGLATGGVILRIKPREEGPVKGFIINEVGEEAPQFLLKLDAYLDAPDLEILGGLAASNLRSTEIGAYIKGPISFLNDGRITLDSTNITTISQSIELSIAEPGTAGPLDPVCGLPILGPIVCGILEPVLTFELGNIDLLIEPGNFNIKVVNHPSRALRLAAPESE